jgi:hypothetical protein
MRTHSFVGAEIVFATNHGKLVAAADCFARKLTTTVTEVAIDSDSLGTFSGEIERPGSMLDALRGKVRLARAVTTARFVMVSEGSFGGVGGIGLIPQAIEMLMVHDAVTGAEIIEQSLSLETNYKSATITTRADLARFMTSIDFGAHALVLYPEGILRPGEVYKGITTEEQACEFFERCLVRSPTAAVVAMSDMRAHLNPTRMRHIAECCELLAERLATLCPACSSGGFGLVSTIPGLPCSECGMATQRARAERHECPFCHKSVEKPRADGRTAAQPGECEWCNP